MTKLTRIKRRQILSEAEGYLDLLFVFADKWPPSADMSTLLATRALKILQKLDATSVDRPYVLYLQGQAYRCMERYMDAVQPLAASAELDPINIHVWLALGWCHKRTGRLDLAIEALESALDVNPTEAIIHFNLACYWSLAENPEIALQYLATALDIDPNYRDLIPDERDFDSLRQHPGFVALTSVIV